MCDDEVKSTNSDFAWNEALLDLGGWTRSPGRQTWFESEGRARTDFLALILSPSLFYFHGNLGPGQRMRRMLLSGWTHSRYLLSPKAKNNGRQLGMLRRSDLGKKQTTATTIKKNSLLNVGHIFLFKNANKYNTNILWKVILKWCTKLISIELADYILIL